MIRALYGRLPGRERSTDERFRRFAVACSRRATTALPGGHSPALDLLEAAIDAGGIDLPAIRRAHRAQIRDPAAPLGDEARRSAAAVLKCLNPKTTTAAMACQGALESVVAARGHQGGWVPGPWPYQPERLAAYEAENAAQVRLVRCIFGSPFRPVAFLPE